MTHYPIERDEVKAQVNQTAKPSEKTKPRQLFWEKRFQNIRPIDIDEKPFQQLSLPEPIKGKTTIYIFSSLCTTVFTRSDRVSEKSMSFEINPFKVY